VTKVPLPSIKKDSEGSPSLDDDVFFYLLKDMFSFENIGFSKNVDGATAFNGDLKYLCCADCELGPLGLYAPALYGNEYLLLVDRVTDSK
jgi:hypothetical protein